jgi:hypothetical protein
MILPVEANSNTFEINHLVIDQVVSTEWSKDSHPIMHPTNDIHNVKLYYHDDYSINGINDLRVIYSIDNTFNKVNFISFRFPSESWELIKSLIIENFPFVKCSSQKREILIQDNCRGIDVNNNLLYMSNFDGNYEEGSLTIISSKYREKLRK